MARSKPQVNIVLVFPDGGGDYVSPAWVRATEILLKAKARRDGVSMDMESSRVAAAQAITPCNDSAT